MKTFIVKVCRIGYAFNEIEIEADSAEEAEVIALDTAGDSDYSEKSAEYETQGVTEIPNKKTIVPSYMKRK